MTKENKIIWIKCWLQIFGDRDNECFYTEVYTNNITWSISMQYNYDFDGYEVRPRDWCTRGFKLVHNNGISDRTEDELDEIIDILKYRINLKKMIT